MILVNLINKLRKSEIGTFLLCAEHYEALHASQISALFAIRVLTRHSEGECIECNQGEQTPIEFDPVPEQIEVYVTFDDDSGNTWSASGRAGNLTYVCDTEGGIYTTMEALRRRGVSRLYIQAGYELHVD